MSSALPATKLSQSGATSTTLQTGGPSTKVAGEQNASVVVQSQLATSTVDGVGASRSNLTQVVQDLTAAHSAHSGWADAESKKITEWGTGEITRLLEQTKAVEQRLVAEAQQRQRLLEESHKVKLSKLVQELDVEKAKLLKEIEDGLQRQIQAALTTSKNDINAIETEMNNRKMALLQQQQLRTGKEIDRLSNLAVEAKLIPSITRTVIETNTETGTVLAVAAGGQISTGQASAQTISSAAIEAKPVAGTVVQATQAQTGDIVTDRTNQKVGNGAIVSSMTEVVQNKQEGERLSGQPIGLSNNLQNPTNMPAGTVHSVNNPITSQIHHPVQHTTEKPHIDAAYGKPLTKPATASADYNKHSTEQHAHKEGLLSKVKHAITGEPRSTDATSKRV